MADPTSAPASYAEVADVLGHLPLLMREARRQRHLSVREAARQLGVSFSTVHRMEQGEDCVLSNVTRVLCWLNDPGWRAEQPEDGTR